MLEAEVLEVLEVMEGVEVLAEVLEVLEVEVEGNLYWMNTSWSKGCCRDHHYRHWGNQHK